MHLTAVEEMIYWLGISNLLGHKIWVYKEVVNYSTEKNWIEQINDILRVLFCDDKTDRMFSSLSLVGTA